MSMGRITLGDADEDQGQDEDDPAAADHGDKGAESEPEPGCPYRWPPQHLQRLFFSMNSSARVQHVERAVGFGRRFAEEKEGMDRVEALKACDQHGRLRKAMESAVALIPSLGQAVALKRSKPCGECGKRELGVGRAGDLAWSTRHVCDWCVKGFCGDHCREETVHGETFTTCMQCWSKACLLYTSPSPRD